MKVENHVNFFLQYLFKFIAIFCILYYGTIAMIAITAPGGVYSPFLNKYFDYVSWLRAGLMHSSKFFLSLFGYKVSIIDIYWLGMGNGSAVHIGYDCIGYGVIFFWLAFIFANKVPLAKKIKWMTGGVIVIWIINVLRISLLLLAIDKNWKIFFSVNNHTLFNVVAYIAIFTMIFLFDRSEKNRKIKTEEKLNNI